VGGEKKEQGEYSATKIKPLILGMSICDQCFGLEGTFRGHLAQPPCSEHGYVQLDQAAQSPVQPGLECFQGWGLHYFSGQPVPVFHHLYRKKFLPYI